MKQKARVQMATILANRLEHETKSFTEAGVALIQSDMERKILDENWCEIEPLLVAKIFQKKPSLRENDKDLSYHDHLLDFKPYRQDP